MSFWDLSDGEQAKSETTYEAPTGGGEPIPDNTNVIAFAEKAEWTNFYESEDQHVNIQWRVTKPEAYKNRVIFHKLDVYGKDARAKDPKKKSDNAKRMLAAIDANAGGQLATVEGAPTSEDLTRALTNKFMTLKVMKWEMDGDDGQKRSGNWIAAVSPKSDVAEPVQATPAPAPAGGGTTGGTYMDDGDSIPF